MGRPIELPACPRCGMLSGIRKYKDLPDGRTGCCVICEQCGYHTRLYATKTAAVIAWEKGKHHDE